MQDNNILVALKNVIFINKKDNTKDNYQVNYDDKSQNIKIRFLKRIKKSKSIEKGKEKKDDKIKKYLDMSIPIKMNYLNLEKIYKLYSDLLAIKIPGEIEIELYYTHSNPYKINYQEITKLEILNINHSYILNMGFIIH